MAAELQPRDHQIFWKIYTVGDGMFSRRQLWAWFWPDAIDESSMTRRLRKLKAAEYIWWPTKRQYRDWRIPESVIILGWRGILDVAEQLGIYVDPPKNPKVKKHLNDFDKRLREEGVYWRRKPTGTPKHDLKVIDIRLAFDRSAMVTPYYSIQERILESRFRREPDFVDHSFWKNGKTETQTKGIIPDDYILIVNEKLRAEGKKHKLHALLEVDMRNHSSDAYEVKKASAYSAYIGSPQYESRFGSKSGRWFVITTGKKRMENLIRITERTAKERAKLFRFTYFGLIENENIFTAPIWWQPYVGEYISFKNLQ